MSKKILILFTSIFLFTALAVCPATTVAAGDASLSLTPASGSFEVGKTFNVSIVASPKGETIDTVRAKLSFSPDLLEVQNFTFGSIYSYQSGGNGYDNSTGSLSQGAGHPGGTTQSGTFGTITFKTKAQGKGVVTVLSNSLMLSAGVNKFNGKAYSANYDLVAPAPIPQETKKETKPKPDIKEEPQPQTEEKPEELSEEDTSEDEELISTETEEAGGQEETQTDTSSEKVWFIAAIIAAVIFGLGGYWFGRKFSKKRKF